jgi:hypothetical protein
MYHLMGSLLPIDNNPPKFIQMYYYDTDHELDNRLKEMPTRNRVTIESLQNMIRSVNPWINYFRSVIERVGVSQVGNLRLKIKAEGRDPRTYNLPTASDIAAIIPGDNDGRHRDIIVVGRHSGLQRINENHRTYDSFNYVLLFPSGEYSWSIDMKRLSGRNLTQMDYYCYRFHYRHGNYTMHRGGRLFLQYAVDAYAKIEQYRLIYHRHHQKELRSEVYNGLVDAINDNNISLEDIGRSYILPSSFYNSPRFTAQQYQDAMAMVRELGKPDLFITFTCNPKWPEILANLLPYQCANDRPDIIARVFHLKMKCFVIDMIDNNILGRVVGYCYTIEFQKRGLPHCHMLLILDEEDKIRNAEDIDEIVNASIPDQATFPLAFETVSKTMVHGPCGDLNPNSPCMKNGICSKG